MKTRDSSMKRRGSGLACRLVLGLALSLAAGARAQEGMIFLGYGDGISGLQKGERTGSFSLEALSPSPVEDFVWGGARLEVGPFYQFEDRGNTFDAKTVTLFAGALIPEIAAHFHITREFGILGGVGLGAIWTGIEVNDRHTTLENSGVRPALGLAATAFALSTYRFAGSWGAFLGMEYRNNIFPYPIAGIEGYSTQFRAGLVFDLEPKKTRKREITDEEWELIKQRREGSSQGL